MCYSVTLDTFQQSCLNNSGSAVPVACFLIHALSSCCSREEGNEVRGDGWGDREREMVTWGEIEREREREREEGDGVRRCREFDSSSCQRRCIIDVLRFPHCRRDFQTVTSRPVRVCVPVCTCHTSLLWSHKSHRSATCQHLHITGSAVSDNAVPVELTTWERCALTHTCTFPYRFTGEGDCVCDRLYVTLRFLPSL